MDTIQSVMQGIMNQPNMRQTYERTVQTVLNDAAVKAFIEAHAEELTTDMISRSMAKLNEFRLERQAIERGETGTTPGYAPELFINTNYIDVKYTPTQALLTQKAQQKLAASLDNRMMSADVRSATLRDYTVDSNARTELLNAVLAFIRIYQESPTQAQGLYIVGPYGVGKTYLLGALANELVTEYGASVTMLHYPTFALDVRNAVGQNRAHELIQAVKAVDVLILDDIGAEVDNSGWLRDEVLGIILEYRMKESLPTFFTSNLDMEAYETMLATIPNAPSQMKAERIMERVRYLAREMTLEGTNRRHLKRPQ